jgi:cytochrome c553
MEMMKHSGFPGRIAAGFIASLGMALIGPQAWSATPAETIQTCESCHGQRGDSQVTTTPRLNGQQAGYIFDRLKKLSDQTRTNPHAKIGMFKDLETASDATRLSIAHYFSSQPPTSPKAGARAAEGKLIFEKGSKADNVIACNQCHGPQGQGHDITPRIAGQHADYLKAQLRLFNLKFRDHIVMKPNTKTMTENTMDALIAYLAND